MNKWVQYSYGSVNLHLLMAQLIQQLRAADPKGSCDAFAIQAAGAGIASVYEPPHNTCPAWYAFSTQGLLFLAVDGASSMGQVSGFMGGADPANLVPFNANTVNTYVVDAAFEIMNALPNQLANNNCFAAGWSLGGAIALEIVRRRQLLQQPFFVPISGCSFGSPKAWGASFVDAAARTGPVRYINQEDWVPKAPPQFADQPILAALEPIRRLVSWNNANQIYDFLVLADFAPFVSPDLPTTSLFPSTTAIAAALLTQDLPPTPGHDIGTYVTRLAAFINSQPPPPPVNNPGVEQPFPGIMEPLPAPNVVISPVQSIRLDRAERAATQVIRAQGAAQDVPVVVIPTANQFGATRVGNVWVVSWQGSLVAVGPTKRRARAMAREANAMLRSVSRQAYVDPNAFVSQLAEYFDAATNPNNGFYPLVSDELPVITSPIA